jgi:polar amino acid transport system permease protein
LGRPSAASADGTQVNGETEIGAAVHDFFHTFFDWSEIAGALPSLLGEGLRNTLLIAVLAIIFGLVCGMLLAVLLLSRRRLVRLPARIYVDVFRGLPAIVTVSLIGLGLPAAGIRPFGRSPLGYAVVAVGLISAAYCAEIFRAGIQAVPAGQMQARDVLRQLDPVLKGRVWR